MSLTVLAWSPRVAPGLLTAEAWDVLRSADDVFVVGEAHPLAEALTEALTEAGVALAVLPPGSDSAAVDLLARAAVGSVVLVPRAEGDHELLAFAAAAVSIELSTVVGSSDLPGSRLLDLVQVMDRLRSPGGCAWDAEQTHRSLVTYLVEETYETVEAIETDDLAGLREELGDLLLQVVFHSRIGEEHATDRWSIDDVADGITDKLVRRHPHVFGVGGGFGAAGVVSAEEVSAGDEPATGASAEELEELWDRQKATEKSRTSAVDGVPLGQPALSLAAKLHDRAARAGVAPEVPLERVPEIADQAQLGDLLLAVVVAARRAGLDPEAALREAARGYADTIRAGEQRS